MSRRRGRALQPLGNHDAIVSGRTSLRPDPYAPLSEGLREAVLAVEGRPIHILPKQLVRANSRDESMKGVA